MLLVKYLPASVLSELRVEFWGRPIDETADRRGKAVGTAGPPPDEAGERCEEVAA